uniref:Uncharacterized protein n=1 Tax=Biomphalaria glabrata TaxID=6526 RepID=A0A2C9KHU6_BIOGL
MEVESFEPRTIETTVQIAYHTARQLGFGAGKLFCSTYAAISILNVQLNTIESSFSLTDRYAAEWKESLEHLTNELEYECFVIVRGCTSILGTLPSPLPPDGCYNWNGAIFCLCRMPICNAAPLPDKSNGLSLDYMVNQITDTQDTDAILRCYQCLTYDTEGKFYPQCPKDAQVNVQTTFLDNCTGMCFTRSFSDNSTKVARGCTSSQYGLPYPLPNDGCYDWEGDTYCVCNRSRCNGLPLVKFGA